MDKMGKVKRKHQNEENYFNKSLKSVINQISEVLPQYYQKGDLLNEFKKLCPYQWNMIEERQKNYKEKEKHLYKVKRIIGRYNTKSPVSYFYSIPKVKYILSKKRRYEYSENYDELQVNKKKIELEKKRALKNNKISEKLLNAKKKSQNIDPEYLNIYIRAYHKKGISTEAKLEIVKELSKFDTKNITRFFQKLNDAERNDMIRNLAFIHLQEFGHYAKLRKKFDGKKKIYHVEKATLDYKKPEDLYEDLKKKSIQSQKKYNIFISHSSEDKLLVNNTIKSLNSEKKVCYCDWTMDNDYLKREFVGEYTKQVLKVRMEQSDILLFLRTENSIKSCWVEFELEYFKSLAKPIYMINKIDDLFDKYKEYNISNI